MSDTIVTILYLELIIYFVVVALAWVSGRALFLALYMTLVAGMMWALPAAIIGMLGILGWPDSIDWIAVPLPAAYLITAAHFALAVVLFLLLRYLYANLDGTRTGTPASQ